MRTWARLLILTLVACVVPVGLGAQDDPSLYVVSYLEVTPASQARAAGMLKGLADASRKENPVRYEVLERTTQPNQFVIIETWKDQAALDAHAGAAHMRQFTEQITPLLLAPVDRRLCVPTVVAASREPAGALYAVTHVDVPPGGRPMAVQLLQALAEQGRKEPGNAGFNVAHEKARTNHFTVMDVWTDQKAADAHQLAERTRAFRTQLGPILGALYDQRWYRAIQGT